MNAWLKWIELICICRVQLIYPNMKIYKYIVEPFADARGNIPFLIIIVMSDIVNDLRADGSYMIKSPHIAQQDDFYCIYQSDYLGVRWLTWPTRQIYIIQ